MHGIGWAKAGRVLLAALSTVLVACTESAGPPQSGSNAPTFDGPTLYRGLILGDGPAADFLSRQARTPRLADIVKDPSQLARVTALQTRLIAAIDRINPGFLDEFAEAMTSGSHHRIQAMYDRAGEITVRTLLTLEETRRVKGVLADRQTLNAAVNRRLAELGRNDPEATAAVQQAVEALASASEPVADNGMPFMKRKLDEGGGGGGGGGANYVYTVFAAVYYVAAVDAAVVSNVAVAISIYVTLAVAGPNILAPPTALGQELLVHSVALAMVGTSEPRSEDRRAAGPAGGA